MDEIILKKANSFYDAILNFHTIEPKTNTNSKYVIIELPRCRLNEINQYDIKKRAHAFWKPSKIILNTNFGIVKCSKKHIWSLSIMRPLNVQDTDIFVTPLVFNLFTRNLIDCSLGPVQIGLINNQISLKNEIRNSIYKKNF